MSRREASSDYAAGDDDLPFTHWLAGWSRWVSCWVVVVCSSSSYVGRVAIIYRLHDDHQRASSRHVVSRKS